MRLLPALLMATLAAAALSACGVSGDDASYAAVAAAPPPPERARLVVYRPAANHLLGQLADHAVTVDGTPACALGDDRFIVRDVPAGPVTIAAGGSERVVDAAAGRATFVRVGFNRRRASLAGWILPLIGFTADAPASESGLFAIEAVAPPDAARELAAMTLDPDCR